MEIKRYYQLEFLELLSYFPVVGIIGPRQVGKTTLSKMILPLLKKEFVYLDLDLSSDLVKLDNAELFFNQNSEKCIIIDEVQRMPSLFPLIRAVVDKTEDFCQFILLGSATPELIGDSSESLAGRIAYLELKPFCIAELPDENSADQLWFRGGFPRALLATSDRLSSRWLDEFIKTYLERDLPLLGLKVSPIVIERLWRMIAHIHGQLLNVSDLAASLGITVPTAKRYIDFLEGAFLIKRIYPFAMNMKKRLVKSPKVYISDTGILHRLLGIQSLDDLFSHPGLGNSWEWFVLQQILALKHSDLQPYFYRTHNRSETDLVLVRGSTPVAAIEIKYTNAPKLSKGNILSVEDIQAPNKFVITHSSDSYEIKEGFLVCSLADFIGEHLRNL